MNVASPRGGFGEITRRSVEVQRSLPYWPRTNSSRPRLADRVADVVQAAEGQHLAGRAPGDDGDAAHLGREVDQHLGRVGVDVGVLGVLDDRGQGAVEVEADEEVVGRPDHGGVLLLPRRRDELHARHCSRSARDACNAVFRSLSTRPTTVSGNNAALHGDVPER